jgi:hypothetical protein
MGDYFMKILTFILFLCSALASASPFHNSNRFSPLGQFDNGYTEAQFDNVLSVFRKVYEPIVEALQGKLVIEADWTDGAVNMWAERWGNQYRLEIPGGMARYYLINEGAFALSICHELGHLLGGAPQRGLISLEGQADYSATRDCMGKIIIHLPFPELRQIDSEVLTLCETRAAEDPVICRTTLQAAVQLSALYAEIERTPRPLLSTPSQSVVQETLVTHPPAQCRLDTFAAGFWGTGRPACWYAGAR